MSAARPPGADCHGHRPGLSTTGLSRHKRARHGPGIQRLSPEVLHVLAELRGRHQGWDVESRVMPDASASFSTGQ